MSNVTQEEKPRIGQVWQELDNRLTGLDARYVLVVDLDAVFAHIRRCDRDGLIFDPSVFKKTRANIGRFNGKLSGYVFVKEAP